MKQFVFYIRFDSSEFIEFVTILKNTIFFVENNCIFYNKIDLIGDQFITALIAIRREDKNHWERRTPLTPDQVQQLMNKHKINVLIQPSKIRTYSDQEYEQVGGIVTEDINKAPIIFALKEIPVEFIYFGKIYLFFAHVIKGQKYNMLMLKKLMDQNCTLIDYERIVNEYNRRLLFFGNYAGYAGMIDTLWATGKRFQQLNIDTPLLKIKPAHKYENLEEASLKLRIIGHQIRFSGVSYQNKPLIIGFLGNGNVSRGAQEILECLPVQEINPSELATWFHEAEYNFHTTYKVVFKINDLVKPKDAKTLFNREDYIKHPEKYESQFEQYLPYLTILINGVYWDDRYPRFVTKKWIKKAYSDNTFPLLTSIGDISTDLNGAIEVNVLITDSGSPIYIYDPIQDKAILGVEGHGPVILAVYNLPAELPKEASRYFGNILKSYIPDICKTNFNTSFDNLNLSIELKRAVIVYKGKLTPDYTYLQNFLN